MQKQERETTGSHPVRRQTLSSRRCGIKSQEEVVPGVGAARGVRCYHPGEDTWPGPHMPWPRLVVTTLKSNGSANRCPTKWWHLKRKSKLFISGNITEPSRHQVKSEILGSHRYTLGDSRMKPRGIIQQTATHKGEGKVPLELCGLVIPTALREGVGPWV